MRRARHQTVARPKIKIKKQKHVTRACSFPLKDYGGQKRKKRKRTPTSFQKLRTDIIKNKKKKQSIKYYTVPQEQRESHDEKTKPQ